MPPASQGWAEAQVSLGELLHALGDRAGMTGSFDAVCEPGNGADRSPWAVEVLLHWGIDKVNAGDFAGAADYAGRALDLAREIGSADREAQATAALSLAAFYGGDAALALDCARRVEKALSASSVQGSPARWCRMLLATVLADAGEIDWGGRECAAGIDLAREVGDQPRLASLLVAKVRLELLRGGDLGVAEADLREAGALSEQGRDHFNLTSCIYLGGYLCAAAGRWAEAVTLWAAADAGAANHGDPNLDEDVYRTRRSEYMEKIERALSPEQIQGARQRGDRMPARAAMELISILMEPASGGSQEAPGDGKLSVRELELVALVAQGRTNAQIAAKLHISVYTVRSHLDRIRDKTGCRRRADLTRLALRQGLV